MGVQNAFKMYSKYKITHFWKKVFKRQLLRIIDKYSEYYVKLEVTSI